MTKKIHINDQGELLLIEPENPSQLALSEAIEKGIKFAPDDVPKLVNLLNTDRSLSFNINDYKGKLFDMPNSYTAEVRTDCGCSNLKGPSKECQEAGGKNPYKCVREDLKVAVLTPLKQSGEPGNEANKEDGKHYATLGDADLTVKVLQWFIDNYSPVKMNAHDLYQIYLKTNLK